MLSTLYINDFNLYGRTYRVQAEAQSRFRQKPEDIGRLYVRGPDGAMIPISSLVRTEFRGGPSLVQRFNGFTSALVTGQPKPGFSSGQMLDAVRAGGRREFAPAGLGYAFSGQSFQERAAGGQGGPGLRARPGHGVPGAGGAVRELVDPLCRAARGSLRRVRRVPRGLAARHCRATSTSRSG